MNSDVQRQLLKELGEKNKELAEKDEKICRLQEKITHLQGRVERLELAMPDCTQCMAMGCGE